MFSVPFVPEGSRPSVPRPRRWVALRRYAAAALLFLTGLTGAFVLLHAVG